MAKEKGLTPVTYSRSVQAEREIPFLIVGSSRWAHDLELLLEDAWPMVFQMGATDPIPEQFSNFGSGCALVEASADFDASRKCIEAALPPHIERVILLKDDDNAFLKKKYLNYAASAGFSVVELSSNAKSAAAELGELLGTFLTRVRTEVEQDIRDAELIVAGNDVSSGVTHIQSLRWPERADVVTGWLFSCLTLPTLEYRLLRLLVRAQPLIMQRQHWPTLLNDTLGPLIQFSQNGKIAEVLPLAVQLTEKIRMNGSDSKEEIEKIISGSKLGLLTKRALSKKIDALLVKSDASSSRRKAA